MRLCCESVIQPVEFGLIRLILMLSMAHPLCSRFTESIGADRSGLSRFEFKQALMQLFILEQGVGVRLLQRLVARYCTFQL